ncbi:Mur ligase family protein [Methanobrevibacter sp. TMH8]|uniref:Mur ligase family protein n=1 Tax=Methanobrevibacter sp. TMH8 TaxID=2848611 RepID=UPI001CCABFBE|nr:Mur ligase family protein [Methanobrevibacter sp. TMH8]
MIDTNITIDSLAEAISGKIIGAQNFRSPNGFTGIFNILKDSTEGDIVIRHWIDEKGIKIASTKNVACIITEDPRGNSVDMAIDLKIPLIVVEKIEEANAVALNWTIKSFAPNSKRVVISGTNGKSTTSHMVYHILKSTGANTLTNTDSKSEFNTLIDPMVPKLISEHVVSNGKELEYLVIEASEVQGWLGKLMHDHAFLMTKSVDPDIAVVTNVAIDHIGLVSSIEEVFNETSGVAKAIRKGVLVLNNDDKKVVFMANFADDDVKTFYFSMNDCIDAKKSNDNIDQYNCLYYDRKEESIIYDSKSILTIDELPFNSDHFIQNTLAAISVCLSLKIEISDIITGVKSYKSLKRRFRKINQSPLIIDDFAHNPEGIKATINAVTKLSKGDLKILCAIRGSRGKELNKINAEALGNVLSSINNDNKENLSNKIELILTSSADVVDEANFVEEFEENIFFDVLNGKNIKYTHYKNLYDSLEIVYNSSNVNDLILLIGAQGMDPAEELLKSIADEDTF